MNIHGLMSDKITYISYSASCKSGVATKLEGGTVILSVLDMSEMNWKHGLCFVEGRLRVDEGLVMYTSLVLNRQHFAAYSCGLQSCGGAIAHMEEVI